MCALLASTAPGLAQNATLSVDQLRDTARDALQNGQAETAVALASALIARDPQDVSALLLKARAQRELGDYKAAVHTARTAWRASQTDLQHYASALVVAQALSSSGARSRAQIWLRRAAQAAPDERLKAKAIKDFRYVRDRNPWTTNLSFGVTPSSNINNGSKSEIVEIDGLPFLLSGDARALSGVEYRFEIDTEYSKQITEKAWVFAAGAVDIRRYGLSSEARQQAPDLNASALRYNEAELTFGATLFPSPHLGPLTVSVDGGRGWYAGDPIVEFYRLNAEQVVPLNARNRLTLSFAADHQHRIADTLNSSSTQTVQWTWAHSAANGDSWQAAFAVSDTRSDGAAVARDGWLSTLQYARAKPVLGAKMSLSFTYEAQRYDRPFFSSETRADQRYSADASFVFNEMQLYGFAPEIGLSAERNSSNIGLYERNDLGITLGIRSVF